MLDFKSFKYVMNSTSITILYLDFTHHSVYMPKYNKLILYCTSNDAWRAIIKLQTLKTAKFYSSEWYFIGYNIYQVLQRCIVNTMANAIVLITKTNVALIQDIDDEIFSATNGSVYVK